MAEQEWKDQVIKTGVDQLMEYLRKEREVRVDEAARSLEVDTDTVITWAKSLQESGLAELQYTARRGRIVRIVADEEKPEDVMKDMQEEMSETVEQLADLGQEQARIDRFQDVLSRLQQYLEKDEAFVAELKEERDDISEDLEELAVFVDDLDMVEEDVSDLQNHLETLQQDIDVLTKLDTLKEQAVDDEQPETGDEDGGSMGPLYPLKKLAAVLPSLGSLHRGGSDAACSVCGKEFDTAQGLDTHRRVTGHEQDDASDDTATETFKCPECDRTFESEHGLRTHMGMVHDEKYEEDNT